MEQQIGAGALDVDGALTVLELSREDSSANGRENVEPSSRQSWLVLANDYAHPDPDWDLRGLVQLRTAAGEVAHGFDPDRLGLQVRPGEVSIPLSEVGPGLWAFAIAAPAGSGGGSLEVRVLFDDRTLLERTVPVAVDRGVLERGVSARGGCAVVGVPIRSNQQQLDGWPWLLVVGLWRRRESQRRQIDGAAM